MFHFFYKRFRTRLLLVSTLACVLGCTLALTSCYYPPSQPTCTTNAAVAHDPVVLQVVNGVVYAANGPGHLTALRADTGAKLWTYAQSTRGYSNATVFTIGQNTVYLGSQSITALRLSDGKEIWHFQQGKESLSAHTVPLLGEHALYVNKGEDIYALDAHTGRTLWMSPGAGTLLTEDAGILYVQQAETLKALQASNGQQKWSMSEPGFTGVTNSLPLIVSDATVYVTIGDHVTALSISDGRERWHFQVSGHISSVTFALNGQLAVISTLTSSSDSALTMLRASDGQALWHFYVPGGTFDQAQIVGSVVYVNVWTWINNSGTQAIYTLRAEDGTKLWTVKIADSSDFIATDGAVYVDMGGGIGAVRTSDGKVLWTQANTTVFETATNTTLYTLEYSSPANCEDTTYKPYVPVTISALHGLDGKQLWQAVV